MKKVETSPFEQEVATLLKKSRNKPYLTVGEILEILSGKGRAILLIFLSLPFCQPIQIPGVAILFGIVIALLGLRMAFTDRILIPRRVLLKRIESKKLEKIAEKTLKFVKKMSVLTHPRWHWISSNRGMQITSGLMVFALGVFLALPLPIPLTNIIAGWPLILIGLGILQDDGLFILIGYIIACLALIAFVVILVELNHLIGKYRNAWKN